MAPQAADGEKPKLHKRATGAPKVRDECAADKEELAKEPEAVSSLEGEYANILILLVLYTLQGLPMGLAAVLPMVLKDKGVSYADLGTFSLNSWPFSLKLCWAPLVDTLYIARVGRRKTWLVPSQLAIGALMLAMSVFIDDLLYVDKPAIWTLTGLFFALYFLCATQDIAVDGWALTMLRPENVGWAATCNAAGQTFGYAVGFTGYMAMEQYKLATLASFMFWWGLAFILVTLLVALFKVETPVLPEEEPVDLVTSYRQMFSMLRLKPVQALIVVMFTWRMAFPTTDSIAGLKFQENGIPKEHMTYITSLLMPMYIMLPVVATRWTAGKTPLDLAMSAYPFRLALVPITAILAYFTPASVTPFPWGFYGAVVFFSAVGAVASEFIFVGQMAFFARVSDPAIGGTYMTFLNTVANLGAKWPSTVALYVLDDLTCKEDTCTYKRDGFYVMTALCTVIGVVWFLLGGPVVHRMGRLPLEDWKVR